MDSHWLHHHLKHSVNWYLPWTTLSTTLPTSSTQLPRPFSTTSKTTSFLSNPNYPYYPLNPRSSLNWSHLTLPSNHDQPPKPMTQYTLNRYISRRRNIFPLNKILARIIHFFGPRYRHNCADTCRLFSTILCFQARPIFPSPTIYKGLPIPPFSPKLSFFIQPFFLFHP